MEIAALISGGKDSIYSLFLAKQQGHTPKVVISMESENKESYMFHVPNIHLAKLQAESMNLPIIYKKTKGEKEKELADLKSAITEAIDKYHIKGLVSGAVFSKYQSDRIANICKELGIISITPIWNLEPEKLWQQLFENNFKIIMVAVAADGLGPDWLGKEITKKEFIKLKEIHKRHPAGSIGEGGEFETLVLHCPLFQKEIKVFNAEPHWLGSSGWYEIKEAELI